MASHRHPEVWRQLVLEQERTGESKVAFCARRRLSPASFHRWCRHFTEGAQEHRASVPQFAQIVPAALAVTAPPAIAELQFPSGPTVRVPVGADVAWVAELSRALSC